MRYFSGVLKKADKKAEIKKERRKSNVIISTAV